MAKKKNVLQEFLSNARARTFILFFGSLFVILGAFIYIKNRPAPDPLAGSQSSTTEVPQQIRSVPGAEVTPQYKALTQAENERRAQEAIKQNSASIPTIIGAIADEESGEGAGLSLDDALAQTEQKKPTFQLGQAEQGGFIGQGLFQANRNREVESQERRLQAQRERLDQQRRERENQQRQQQQRQEQAKKADEYKKAVQAQSQRMAQTVSKTAAEWGSFPTQAYVQGQYATQPAPVAPQTLNVAVRGQGNTVSSGAGTRTAGSVTTAAKQRIIKAGTILYGVLDTSIDTDVASPVLATIVHGPLRGGKLIGQFTFGPRDESLRLQFTTLSLPKEPRSYGVSIVAVDADSAKTALEGNLDKHLFIRYGSLFASSFIEGYAQAVSQQGTTTTSPLTGATTETKEDLSGSEEFFTALGLVGQRWGQAIAPLVERPYTIKIKEGTGVGLLFLSDTDLTPKTQAGS